MSKSCPTISEDLMLADIAAANVMVICSAQPVDYSGIAAVTLASIAMVPGAGNGDYTLANDTGGRSLAISAKTPIPVTANGMATHIVLALTTGAPVLKYVTTCTPPQALSTTKNAAVPGWKITIPGPV